MCAPAYTHWYRHGRTWFVGVDAMPNDANGQLADGPPLAGAAIRFLRNDLGFSEPWHHAQLSVCFPGYPQRDAAESEAQHRFRITRDAAHVDGLLAEGESKRRHLREFHRFILGIPLNETEPKASPFVIWEGSHHILADVFREAFADMPESNWGEIDLTDAYQAARRRVFDSCKRVEIHCLPGEAYIAHRFSLHGVAPWTAANSQSRIIAYFRPETTDQKAWLDLG